MRRGSSPPRFHLQGFDTLLAASAPRIPAGLQTHSAHGILPFEAHHATGCAAVSSAANPHAVFLATKCMEQAPRIGGTSRGFWALTPADAPPTEGSHPQRWKTSLGFSFSGSSGTDLDPTFEGSPLLRFSATPRCCAGRFRVSFGRCLAAQSRGQPTIRTPQPS